MMWTRPSSFGVALGCLPNASVCSCIQKGWEIFECFHLVEKYAWNSSFRCNKIAFYAFWWYEKLQSTSQHIPWSKYQLQLLLWGANKSSEMNIKESKWTINSKPSRTAENIRLTHGTNSTAIRLCWLSASKKSYPQWRHSHHIWYRESILVRAKAQGLFDRECVGLFSQGNGDNSCYTVNWTLISSQCLVIIVLGMIWFSCK